MFSSPYHLHFASLHKMSDVPPNYSLLDEFLAEDDILDDVFSEITGILKSSVEALHDVASDHRLRPRRYFKRPREENQQKLYDDYSQKILCTLHLFFEEDFVCQGHLFCTLSKS